MKIFINFIYLISFLCLRTKWPVFFVIHPSLPASLLSFPPVLFSITLPIVHFPLLWMGFRCSDLLCVGRNDRQAASIPRSLTRGTHARSHAQTWIPPSSPRRRTIAPRGDYPDFILGCATSLSVHVQVVMTERSQKAGGFKLGTSCFEKWLIGGLLLQRGGNKQISKVNSRGKWILMKAYMCKDTNTVDCWL